MGFNGKSWLWRLIIALSLLATGSVRTVVAQVMGGSKGIESTEVIERPVKSSAGKPRRRATYRSTGRFRKNPAPTGTEYASLGLTIWRLQADGAKDLGQEGEEAQTLEQVEANTQLAIGSRVRLGIETLAHN